jgi:hypothetical protein
MNSGDTLHCSLCRTVETRKCSRRRRRRRRREEQATLHGGDVWLTVETMEAGDELRELLGRWMATLLIFPLFLLFFLLSFSSTF